ncbi:hypothetical protein GY45DRAFT_1214340, partial [Cubamyces sp. BRFM 1775]
LECTQSIISGSGSLVIVGSPAVSPRDLDIYVPRANLFHIIGYLTNLEGYSITSYGSTAVADDGYSRGVLRVLSLTRGNARIDIVQSEDDCSTLPVPQFWSTAPMNVIRGYSICILYPQLLERGLALLNPARKV